MPTPESSLEVLAERVAKLETQNRRLKKIGIASFIVMAALVAMGQASGKKIIEADEFRLKDGHGKTRARLYTIEGAGPVFSFADEGNNVQMELMARQGKTSLFLNDTDYSNAAGYYGGGRSFLLDTDIGFVAHGKIGTFELSVRDKPKIVLSETITTLNSIRNKVLWSAPQ